MTTSQPPSAFEFEGVSVRLDRLLPTKTVPEKLKQTIKYQALLASIREVGLVEPLSVYRQKGGRFLILDGHARAMALKDVGAQEASCLLATRDEAYTYNQKVNRIAPIQANRMILKALDAGVAEERIARALNLSPTTVRGSRRLLQSICPEAIELLKDKHIALGTLALLKRVKPLRQMEMAEVMVASGTYTATYARILMMTTPKGQLVHPEKHQKLSRFKAEDLARIEHETRVQERDFRMLDETYNENVMALTLARGYLRSLLENSRVVRFLAKHHAEFLAEFQRVVEANGLEN